MTRKPRVIKRGISWEGIGIIATIVIAIGGWAMSNEHRTTVNESDASTLKTQIKSISETQDLQSKLILRLEQNTTQIYTKIDEFETKNDRFHTELANKIDRVIYHSSVIHPISNDTLNGGQLSNK